MNYFVTAIGTDSGKTIISAALAMAIDADYWKPIQAGSPTDTEKVVQLTEATVNTHKETYFLKTAASPHLAAKNENISISLNDFKLPESNKRILTEGAGGCLVPINEHESVIDIAKKLELEIILVSNNYLGSINHTLLTINYLDSIGMRPKGIIFNGLQNQSTEDIILKRSQLQCLLNVGQLDEVNSVTILALCERFKQRWDELGW